MFSKAKRTGGGSSAAANKNRAKGMQLGKKKKADEDFFAKMHKEEGLKVMKGPLAGSKKKGASAEAVQQSYDMANIVVEEKVSIVMERDGTLKKMDIKGELRLTVFDPDDAKIVIHTNGALAEGFKHKLMLKLDKKAYAKEGTIGYTKQETLFPVGSDSSTVLLRWRRNTLDDDSIPLTLEFWPNDQEGKTVVNAEFSANTDRTLRDVSFNIPCTAGEAPEILEVTGDYSYDRNGGFLSWTTDEVDPENESGQLDFSVPEIDHESFFPVNVDFSSEQTYSGLEIVGVTDPETGDDKKYDVTYRVVPETYIIE